MSGQRGFAGCISPALDRPGSSTQGACARELGGVHPQCTVQACRARWALIGAAYAFTEACAQKPCGRKLPSLDIVNAGHPELPLTDATPSHALHSLCLRRSGRGALTSHPCCGRPEIMASTRAYGPTKEAHKQLEGLLLQLEYMIDEGLATLGKKCKGEKWYASLKVVCFTNSHRLLLLMQNICTKLGRKSCTCVPAIHGNGGCSFDVS